jgi:hypothetical protein
MGSFVPESSSTATAGHQPSCHTQSGVLRAQSHVRPSWFFAVLKTPTGRNSGMFGAQFWLKQNKLSKAP